MVLLLDPATVGVFGLCKGVLVVVFIREDLVSY